ncbi:MAG: UDP-glucose 4-epimerase GalE, partial [Verrucomicrobiota bacterium]
EALDEKSRIYNLGNGQGFSVREVIEAAREVTGHSIPCEMTDRRSGDADRLVADSRAIREDLGWEPQYPDIRTIIETAWAWHQAHPQGYGS